MAEEKNKTQTSNLSGEAAMNYLTDTFFSAKARRNTPIITLNEVQRDPIDDANPHNNQGRMMKEKMTSQITTTTRLHKTDDGRMLQKFSYSENINSIIATTNMNLYKERTSSGNVKIGTFTYTETKNGVDSTDNRALLGRIIGTSNEKSFTYGKLDDSPRDARVVWRFAQGRTVVIYADGLKILGTVGKDMQGLEKFDCNCYKMGDKELLEYLSGNFGGTSFAGNLHPIKDKEEAFIEEGFCVLCLDEKRTHILWPCSHVCLCASCAELLLRSKNMCCPLCRRNILYIGGLMKI